jgi:hypothetical protein
VTVERVPAEREDVRPIDLENVRCVACKQEIRAGASVCSVCKSYQRPWKNHLMYAAGIATMLALIASAGFWLVGNGRMLLGFARDDIRVIAGNTVLGNVVVVNRGDREVFVSHLLLFMPGRTVDWDAPELIFDERLPPGQFLRGQFNKPRIPDFLVVRGLGSIHFEDLIKRAARQDPCFEMNFFVAQDSLLREFSQMMGPTLNTFEVAGYLEYWRLTGDAPVDLPVKGTGVVMRAKRPECR